MLTCVWLGVALEESSKHSVFAFERGVLGPVIEVDKQHEQHQGLHITHSCLLSMSWSCSREYSGKGSTKVAAMLKKGGKLLSNRA